MNQFEKDLIRSLSMKNAADAQILQDALLATVPAKEEADSLSNLPLLFL